MAADITPLNQAQILAIETGKQARKPVRPFCPGPDPGNSASDRPDAGATQPKRGGRIPRSAK